MARKLSGRELFLVGVLVVAAGAVLFWRDDGPLSGRTADQPDAVAKLGDAPQVHWDRLFAEAEGYDPGGRNLFQFYTPPPPAPVRQAPPKPIVRPATPAQAPSQIVKAPPKPTLQRPPTISFKYLGYLGPKDDKIAVFEQGQELQLARVGEIVQKDFRLVDFKYEGVVIGYVDERFRDQTTELRMSR